MDYVSGEILTHASFDKGYLGFEKNNIVEVGRGIPPKKPICKGMIIPTFVNSHTHIGDSFIRKKNIELPRNVEELVAPPQGLKHRLLTKVSEKEIVNGMIESVHEMIASGTSVFCDFRENGVNGVNQLKKALEDKKISSLILSRPRRLEYNHEEIEILLKNSQGIGLSSISDWNYSELEKVAKHAKRNRKIFAIHASERTREDIDLILDLKPDFLIHMVKATESDLIRVKDTNTPVVICPRSNAFFGLKSNVETIKKIGIDLIVGTDNAMLNPPNILDEIKYVRTISKDFSTWELLYIITFGARKALNLDCNILGPNSPSDFMVLDGKKLKTLYISINK